MVPLQQKSYQHTHTHTHTKKKKKNSENEWVASAWAHLLENLDELLDFGAVKVCVQTLHSGQCLATVALLQANVCVERAESLARVF